MSVLSWIERVIGGVEKEFFADEKLVLAYMAPLADQLLVKAKQLGKNDVAAGLQVLKDSVAVAVAAGATAAAAGQSPVAASEAAFLTTTAGEGLTALHNAEAAAIKVGVAEAQEASAALSST